MNKFNFKNEDYPFKRLLRFCDYTQDEFAVAYPISQSKVSRLTREETLSKRDYLLFLTYCIEEFANDNKTYEQIVKAMVVYSYGK